MPWLSVPWARSLALAILLVVHPGLAGAVDTVPEEPADPLFDEDFEALEPDTPANDPWEDANRGIFSFNRGLDRYVLDPVTHGYQLVVPAPVRHALHRVVLNLDSPVVFANHVLQLRLDAAGVTLGRFVVNSTAGVAGLFDAAAEGAGIEPIDADFGQTLARYGTPSGPYLMLPLFGPSTVRDALGLVVDAAGDPLTYLIGPFQWWTLLLGTGEGLVVREANIDDLNALEEGSIDFYAALRSAYLQNREARMREAREAAPDLQSSASSASCGQLSSPPASFAILASSVTSSASRSPRFMIELNSERRNASSLTVPSR